MKTLILFLVLALALTGCSHLGESTELSPAQLTEARKLRQAEVSPYITSRLQAAVERQRLEEIQSAFDTN